MKTEDIFSTSATSNYQDVLLVLTRLDISDLDQYFDRVCSLASTLLGIKRASIWFFDEKRTKIYCRAGYQDPTLAIPEIKELNISDYSEYFEASKHLRTITTYDALSNPLTSEFAESYLKPLGINSMMDVPIWVRGKIFGVICFEQIGSYRDWSTDDQSFAASVAEVISRAIETNHSRQKEAEYEESQRFLTTLISNLPGYVYRCSERNGQWFVEYASEGIFDLTGYRSEDMLSDQNLYSTLVHPDDSEIQARVVVDSIRSKKPYQITYRIHTADGKQKWVWEQGRGVYSSEGHLIATEGFITEITEKKKVEEELINRNIELSILNQIGQSLSRLAEPKEIIDILFTTIGRLFDASNFYLALFDENRKMLTYPIYIVDGEVKDTPAKRFENGIPEYVIDTKKTILLNDDLSKKLGELGIDHSDNACRAIMSAPLLAGDKVIGVMTLQNYSNETKYGESQLEILTTIASQAGIAIQNARLYDEVKKSLGEKDVLLQEVHHRVKNNLQIMSSLVKLQSQHIKDPATREILKESENRIRSMAIVHTKLYNSRDYESIDFGDYVRSLTESFYTTYGMRLNRIRIDIEIRDIILNIDTAIPCGLIINELVSNAIKHAFPNIKDGKITISLLANNDHSYTMLVKDNGIGLPEGFDPRTSKTLGIELVTLLTNQLNGKLEYNTNGGTEFIITFEESTYKERA